MKKTEKCAQVVIQHPKTKKILGVSRKDNHNDFSLAGGKHESFDVGMAFTATRELLEETGIKRKIDYLTLIHKGEYDGKKQYTYTTSLKESDVISTRENHVVKWCDPAEIMAGSFGDYNKMIFEKMGII